MYEYPVMKAGHWSPIQSPTHSESELEENDIPLSFSPEPEPTTLDLRREQADQESLAMVCGVHRTQIGEEDEKAGELASVSSYTGALATSYTQPQLRFHDFPVVPTAGNSFDNSDIFSFGKLRRNVGEERYSNELAVYYVKMRVIRVEENTLDF